MSMPSGRTRGESSRWICRLKNRWARAITARYRDGDRTARVYPCVAMASKPLGTGTNPTCVATQGGHE